MLGSLLWDPSQVPGTVQGFREHLQSSSILSQPDTNLVPPKTANYQACSDKLPGLPTPGLALSFCDPEGWVGGDIVETLPTTCTLTRIDQDIHMSEYSQTKQFFTGFVRFPHHLREKKSTDFTKVQRHERWPCVQAGGLMSGACWSSEKTVPLTPDMREGTNHWGQQKSYSGSREQSIIPSLETKTRIKMHRTRRVSLGGITTSYATCLVEETFGCARLRF